MAKNDERGRLRPPRSDSPTPRARDHPELLARLPHLSETEAEELARDLERARDELNRRERPPDT